MKSFFTYVFCLFIWHWSHAQINTNISNGNIFEGEPYLAINPNNNQHMIVAWMGFVPGTSLSIKVKYTYDAGKTWSNNIIIPHVVSTYKSADPSIQFDQNGNAYLCYIDYRESPDSGGVYIAKSSNGGQTWNAPIKVIDALADGSKIPLDRPWLVVGPDGKEMYVTTKPAPWILPPNRPYLITSGNGGNTWNAWRYLDTINYLVGNGIAAPMAAPVFAGKKTFMAVYPSYLVSQSLYGQYFMAKSNNLGTTLTYRTAYTGVMPVPNDSAKLGYRFFVNRLDSNQLGLLYPAVGSGDIDVMYIESRDGGNNWTSPKRVNDDPSGNDVMQDLFWGAFDEQGNLVVTWRDRRNAKAGMYATASEIYYAYKHKDSSQFTINRPVSSSLVAYNNILSQNGNDFMSCVLSNDTLSAVWGDTRSGALNIWFARIKASTGAITAITNIEGEKDEVWIYPNPTHQIVMINFKSPIKPHFEITNIEGKKVLDLRYDTGTNFSIDLSEQPNGHYFIKWLSGGKQQMQRVVKN